MLQTVNSSTVCHLNHKNPIANTEFRSVFHSNILLGLNIVSHLLRYMNLGAYRSKKAHSNIYYSWNGCRAANHNASLEKDKLIDCNAFKSHRKAHRMRDRWQPIWTLILQVFIIQGLMKNSYALTKQSIN